jgi:hypothetical protein
MATAAGAAAMAELVAQVRGDVLTADDGRYEDARKLYNAMIDKRPQVIVRCVDVADVIAVNMMMGGGGRPRTCEATGRITPGWFR